MGRKTTPSRLKRNGWDIIWVTPSAIQDAKGKPSPKRNRKEERQMTFFSWRRCQKCGKRVCLLRLVGNLKQVQVYCPECAPDDRIIDRSKEGDILAEMKGAFRAMNEISATNAENRERSQRASSSAAIKKLLEQALGYVPRIFDPKSGRAGSWEEDYGSEREEKKSQWWSKNINEEFMVNFAREDGDEKISEPGEAMEFPGSEDDSEEELDDPNIYFGDDLDDEMDEDIGGEIDEED